MPPTRRAGSKPFAIEGFNEATQQWEMPQPGPALQRLPGRRAAGQSHRRAQRDRVLGVRRQGAGLRRCDQRLTGVSGDARRSGARPRARPVRQRTRCAAQLHAARAATRRGAPATCSRTPSRLGFVAGAIPGRMVLPAAAAGLAPGAGPVVRHAGGDGRRPGAVGPARAHAQPGRAAGATAANSRSIACATPPPRWPPRWTASSPTTTASRSATEALDVIGADLEQLYDTLDARDLAAGSPLARRLFS